MLLSFYFNFNKKQMKHFCCKNKYENMSKLYKKTTQEVGVTALLFHSLLKENQYHGV